MAISNFCKNDFIGRFIKDSFGDIPYWFEGKDTILKTGVEKDSIEFCIGFSEEYLWNEKESKYILKDDLKSFPEIFNSDDFCLKLKKRFETLNQTETTFWMINYTFNTEMAHEVGIKVVSIHFTFTVKY
jgi:hypothetical protein